MSAMTAFSSFDSHTATPAISPPAHLGNDQSSVLYPYQVIYTGNGSTNGISTISFATSTRPDTRVSYAGVFAATTTQRISEINAPVNGSVVRKYLLGNWSGLRLY
jgi:hypothetical protein